MSRGVCQHHHGGKSGLCSSSGFTRGVPGSAPGFLKDPGYTPAHRPWDCAIDLLSEASPPRGHVYPLSYAETEAMETYVQESLQQSFICLLKSLFCQEEIWGTVPLH